MAAGSGCAHSNSVELPEQSAVGPAKLESVPAATTGTLVVYSAWDGFDTSDPEHAHHSSYEVYSKNGKRLFRVRNYHTPMLEDPAAVPLAQGEYIIKARAQGYSFVKIPVVIKRDQVTDVHLDGSQPNSRHLDCASIVHLPNGQPVGWRASAE